MIISEIINKEELKGKVRVIDIPRLRFAHQIKFSPKVAFGNSSPMCDLLGLTSQTK